LAPLYNVTPTDVMPVVRQTQDGRELAMMRWGLVPYWAKDLSIGNKQINARAETIATRPAFKEAFHRRRCLVPTDGFYEWKKDGKKKQPYRIIMADDSVFAFAGLWERCRSPAGENIETLTIITGEPNDLVQP